MNTLKIIEGQRDGEWVWKCADRYNQTWVHKEHGERIINTELLNYILIQILESEIERKRGMKYSQPLLGTPIDTERVMNAVNMTIEEDITHLTVLLDSLK